MTLAGPPGAGKTRLALQAARQLLPGFRGGAWFVELAGVADPARVRATVAAALRVTLRAGERDDVEVALGNAQLLVLLDNCEQKTCNIAVGHTSCLTADIPDANTTSYAQGDVILVSSGDKVARGTTGNW